MKKKCVIIPFLFLSFVSFARTIKVGKGQQVSSISAAIQSATTGDTIVIEKGTYKEGTIRITKSLVVLGAGEVILDGENKYEIFVISGNGIVIRGLTFKNSGASSMNDFAAIKMIDCRNVMIEKNKIINAYFAIHISNASFCTIRNNLITGTPGSEQNTGNGIHLWKCNNMLVADNTVIGHRDGIYFEFVTASDIRNNHSEKNIRYGLHFMFSHSDTYSYNTFKNNGAGVAVMYSKKVKMVGNVFVSNWGASAYGILLKDITDSEIINNRFTENTVGIHMEGSNRVHIYKNSFKENGWGIRVQASCDDNAFESNNFMSNTFDVSTNGTMVLNRFLNNYWDKYDGYDLNKDGKGDVPYHPVSMYSMLVEQNPTTIILLRSFLVSMLDKAERAIPSLTPENLRDDSPVMRPNKL